MGASVKLLKKSLMVYCNFSAKNSNFTTKYAKNYEYDRVPYPCTARRVG